MRKVIPFDWCMMNLAVDAKRSSSTNVLLDVRAETVGEAIVEAEHVLVQECGFDKFEVLEHERLPNNRWRLFIHHGKRTSP